MIFRLSFLQIQYKYSILIIISEIAKVYHEDFP